MTICIGQSCCAERMSHGKEGHECTPREVHDAAYLCRPCRSRLAQLVADLPGLHDDLGLALTSARRRVSGPGRSKGLNVEDVVSAARDHVIAWLFDWSRIVAEERGLHLPAPARPDTFAHWLGRHLDWLAHQRYADEVLANLEETHGEARRARQIVPPRRFVLRLPDGRQVRCTERAEGPMPSDAPPGATPMCPGVIGALVRETSSLLPSEVSCSLDPAHRWEPHLWHALGRHVRPGFDSSAMQVLAKALGA